MKYLIIIIILLKSFKFMIYIKVASIINKYNLVYEKSKYKIVSRYLFFNIIFWTGIYIFNVTCIFLQHNFYTWRKLFYIHAT